jgi:hypothetical protein
LKIFDIKGTSINSFWNTNAGIFFRYKAPKTEFSIFGNLPLPAGRSSSWKKAQVGRQNGIIRGPLKAKLRNR